MNIKNNKTPISFGQYTLFVSDDTYFEFIDDGYRFRVNGTFEVKHTRKGYAASRFQHKKVLGKMLRKVIRNTKSVLDRTPEFEVHP